MKRSEAIGNETRPPDDNAEGIATFSRPMNRIGNSIAQLRLLDVIDLGSFSLGFPVFRISWAGFSREPRIRPLENRATSAGASRPSPNWSPTARGRLPSLPRDHAPENDIEGRPVSGHVPVLSTESTMHGFPGTAVGIKLTKVVDPPFQRPAQNPARALGPALLPKARQGPRNTAVL